MTLEGKSELQKKLLLTLDDLEPGRRFVTQRKGFDPESIQYLGAEGGRVNLLNVESGRPFKASLSRFLKKRVGYSRIISAEPIEVVPSEEAKPQQGESQQELLAGLGTNMLFIIPNEGLQEPVPAAISKAEPDGTVILGLPDNPEVHLFRVDAGALEQGEDNYNKYVLVPRKFSLIMLSDEEIRRLQAEAVERDLEGVRSLLSDLDLRSVVMCPDAKFAGETWSY